MRKIDSHRAGTARSHACPAIPGFGAPLADQANLNPGAPLPSCAAIRLQQ